MPAARQWYAKKQADYLTAGVDFWWNDEGETMYLSDQWNERDHTVCPCVWV